MKAKKKITLDFWVSTLKSGAKFYKTADLMKVSGLSCAASRATARRLAKKGLLVRVGKELFGNSLAGFSIEEASCEASLPSYLSCEYALSRHGVINQMPVVITAVTLKRGKRRKIGQIEISYTHLRKNLFWGFAKENGAFVAEPEKALLDWLYFRGKTFKNLDEINWEAIDVEKTKTYAAAFPAAIRKMLTRILPPSRVSENKKTAPLSVKNARRRH